MLRAHTCSVQLGLYRVCADLGYSLGLSGYSSFSDIKYGQWQEKHTVGSYNEPEAIYHGSHCGAPALILATGRWDPQEPDSHLNTNLRLSD